MGAEHQRRLLEPLEWRYVEKDHAQVARCDVTDEQTLVSDDWTRNWHAKIAVKTTAIFVWFIVFASFGVLVYVTHDLEHRIQTRLVHDTDSLAYRIHHLVARFSPEGLKQDPGPLQSALSEELRITKFSGVRLRLGEWQLTVGRVDAQDLVKEVREFTYPMSGVKAREYGRYLLEAAHHPVENLARDQRDRILMAMVGCIVATGLLLIWTINNVLARPFRSLVNATRSVSRGNLELRLDVSREDEFGQLSRFFNEMLERVQSQQDELTQTNRDLRSEVAVRKRAEEQLEAHRLRLEQLVEERTRDLEDARDQALQASHTKSAFIANISHEIRTPLTPIIGFAEALLDGRQSREEQRQCLRTIIRNGRHLLSLINEILDLSKIEADRLDVEILPVDPLQILSHVDSLIGMLAREKGLCFEMEYRFPLPERVFTDPTRLKQILMNLGTNAVKFTDKGCVRLQVAFDADTDQLRIAVVDTGIGISGEKRERLFRAFSQADSTTARQFGGTGLGLYISQRLAALLGGNVELDSVEGVGSRFTLTISAGAQSGSIPLIYCLPEQMDLAEEETAPSAVSGLKGKVLLAEDNPDNQQLISYYLKRLGIEVDVCENGKMAVEAAMGNEYGLVLMDMQMPVVSGLEAVSLLRGSGYTGPIYALTASALREDIEQYLAAGCTGYLAKPVEQDKFRQVLAAHLAPVHEPLVPPSVDAAGEEDPEYQRLVQRFLNGLPDLLERLTSSVAAKAWEEASGLAHQLKGLGGGFGFPAITDGAASLERSLAAGRYVQAEKDLKSLLELAQEIVACKGVHGDRVTA